MSTPTTSLPASPAGSRRPAREKKWRGRLARDVRSSSAGPPARRAYGSERCRCHPFTQVSPSSFIPPAPMNPEADRLAKSPSPHDAWRAWGPYVSSRQWGTVREDYSPDGEAWTYFPHEHARSRAYRWGEDGIFALCDREQRLCFAPTFWNGADPILKERFFGLTGPQGNHGEDVKEEYWYLEAAPTASWLRALYRYPQRAFSLRPPGRRKRPARSPRSGIRTPRYRHLRGGSLFRDRGRLREGFAGRHPHPDHREKLRTRPGPTLDSADAVVPQSLDMGSRATESVGSRHFIHRTPHGSGRIARRMVAGRPHSRGNPFHRKRNQQHAPLRHAGRLAVHQGCLSSPPRRRREGGGQSGESRNQSRRRLPFQPRPGHLGHFGNATPLGAGHEPGGFPPGDGHPESRVCRIL